MTNRRCYVLLAACAFFLSCDALFPLVPNPNDCVAHPDVCKVESGETCDPLLHTCFGGGCATKVSCMNPAQAVCSQNQCIPCSFDNECRAWSDARNEVVKRYVCRPADHLCVQCRAGMEITDCTDPTKPACDTTGVCRGCKQDSECPSGICRKVGDYPQTSPVAGIVDGQCVPETAIVYVNNAMAVCSDTANDGSKLSPFCTINKAKSVTGKPYIRVAGSGTAYPSVTITSGSYVIVGAGRDATGMNASVFDQFVVTSGSLVISNVQVNQTGVGTAAISCMGSGASLFVLDSTVASNSGRGLDAENGCGNLFVERSRLTSQREALGISGTGGNYRIVNNAFSHLTTGGTGGEQYAVHLGTNASGYFGFNTVTRYLAGVFCDSNQTLEDSIISNTGTNMVIGCDTNNHRVFTGAVTFLGPTFLEPKLVDDATDRACCIDKSMKPAQSVPTDHYGTPRPQKQEYDIGYHELQ